MKSPSTLKDSALESVPIKRHVVFAILGRSRRITMNGRSNQIDKHHAIQPLLSGGTI
jgi:hypothetical protein